jgi:hypothetical protein
MMLAAWIETLCLSVGRPLPGNFDCLQRVLDGINRTIDQSGENPRENAA